MRWPGSVKTHFAFHIELSYTIVDLDIRYFAIHGYTVYVCGHRTARAVTELPCAVTELPCAVTDPLVRSPNCPVRSPIRVCGHRTAMCGHRTTMCGHRSANAIQQKLFPTQAVDNYNTFSSSSAMINVRGESLPHLVESVGTQL